MNTTHNRRRFLTLFLGIFAMWLMACSGGDTTPAPSATEPTDTPPTEVAKPTEAAPTATTEPTATVEPTATSEPTATPEPTATLEPTPLPEPIVLTGTGDNVVDFEKFEGAAIARIAYIGERNLIITSYDESGEQLDLLVNHIGAYNGVRPIDFIDGERATRFEVQASGEWTIEIVPLAAAEVLTVPGMVEGTGDTVYLVEGVADTVMATATEGNFAVYGYNNRRNLIINEIAPYEGTSLLPDNLIVLVVETRGAWSLDFQE